MEINKLKMKLKCDGTQEGYCDFRAIYNSIPLCTRRACVSSQRRDTTTIATINNTSVWGNLITRKL